MTENLADTVRVEVPVLTRLQALDYTNQKPAAEWSTAFEYELTVSLDEVSRFSFAALFKVAKSRILWLDSANRNVFLTTTVQTFSERKRTPTTTKPCDYFRSLTYSVNSNSRLTIWAKTQRDACFPAETLLRILMEEESLTRLEWTEYPPPTTTNNTNDNSADYLVNPTLLQNFLHSKFHKLQHLTFIGCCDWGPDHVQAIFGENRDCRQELHGSLKSLSFDNCSFAEKSFAGLLLKNDTTISLPVKLCLQNTTLCDESQVVLLHFVERNAECPSSTTTSTYSSAPITHLQWSDDSALCPAAVDALCRALFNNFLVVLNVAHMPLSDPAWEALVTAMGTIKLGAGTARTHQPSSE